MKYEWLLFDADGTLFDYDAAEKTALSSTFEAYDLPFSDTVLNLYRNINGHLWQAFEQGDISQESVKTERFKRLFDAVGIREELSIDAFSQLYLEHLGNCTFLIPHAESVLSELSDKVQLALITNGLSRVQRSRLSQSTIGHYFDPILISEELGVAKPDPGIFDAAFMAMGNPDKSTVLIIGDSLSSDIKGGRDYGIDTCWHNPHANSSVSSGESDYVIQNLLQILDIL
jgi:YjjG family noncanonical pyrimidine nucleotidase